jgi:hypothetical protein
MAGPFDFTGNNIQDTYQRIVQTDGTSLFDGTGSAVTVISASYAISASHAETFVTNITNIENATTATTASYVLASNVDQPFTNITASGTVSASVFIGDGSQLTGINSSGEAFPHSGSAEITGSLKVIGPLTITGSQLITDDITSSGTLRAKVKSFDIVHPTKPGKRLVYGVMEGPEHGVYCRGRSQELKVKLPPEWSKLVVPSTITVQITSAGKFQPIYFEKFISNWLYFGCDLSINEYDFFWEIKGARADVPKLRTTQ